MAGRPVPRPAVPWALCFLAGIGLGSAGAAPIYILGLAGLLAALGVRRATRTLSVRLAALVAVAACGAWLMNDAREAARARVREWLPEDGTPVQVLLRGRVLDVPEAGAPGERRLQLAGRPEGRPVGDPARILLRILASPDDATLEVDALRPGDEVRVWALVRLPRPPGDPEQLDARTALLARGVDVTGTVKSARLVDLVRRGSATPGRLLGACKVAARVRLDRAVGRDSRARAVLGAMLLGDRASLDPAEGRILRDSGLVHLLSISGLHVGLLVVFLLAILGRTRLGPAGVFVALVLAVAALSVLTGGQPPVLRSALSAGLLLLGRLLGRDGDPLNTLAVAAAALAALRPHILWDPSFQLTVTATAGLLAFAGSVAAAIPLPRILSLSLGVSASAYLASFPFVLVHFGRAAPVSLLSNLGASLFCAATLVCGGAAMSFAGAPYVGAWFGRLAEGSVGALLGFASGMGVVPGGAFRTGPPPTCMLAGYYALLLLAAHPRVREGLSLRAGRGGSRLLRLTIFLVLGVMHVGPPPPGPSSRIEVAVLDVGQGQAVVLRGLSGGFVLVDAGGTAGGRFDAGERIVAPFLARRGCRRLEVLVITHGHDDHAGGASAILREFEVGELWVAAGAHREPEIRDLEARARAQGTAVVLVERGFQVERVGMKLNMLHPTRSDLGLSENDRSVVLHAAARGASVLVPGDLETAGEDELTSAADVLRADVLVVGHHGAPRSSGTRFLEAVDPAVAVISVGASNRFGHPGPVVLERLRRAGALVLRTDRDGRILLRRVREAWDVETGIRRTGSERE